MNWLQQHESKDRSRCIVGGLAIARICKEFDVLQVSGKGQHMMSKCKRPSSRQPRHRSTLSIVLPKHLRLIKSQQNLTQLHPTSRAPAPVPRPESKDLRKRIQRYSKSRDLQSHLQPSSSKLPQVSPQCSLPNGFRHWPLDSLAATFTASDTSWASQWRKKHDGLTLCLTRFPACKERPSLPC